MRSPSQLRRSSVALAALVLGADRPAGSSPVRDLYVGHASRAATATATIEGRVEISRALTARRPRFRIYAEPGVGAVPPEPTAQDERANVVLYVERVPEGTVPPAGATAERPVLRQRDERFSPHVLPIVRGTTVAFVNDDPLFHNVFSLSRAKEFDLGRYPRGVSRSQTFDRPGVVQVFCHIHSDMSATLLVLDNGFYAVPDSSGRYAIPSLPAGEYTVVAWHERIRPIAHRLRVTAGDVATLDFTIPLPAADAARER
jgi:plastocyanin